MKQILILIAIIFTVQAVPGQVSTSRSDSFYRPPDPTRPKPLYRALKPNLDRNRAITASGWIEKARLLLERSKSYKALGIRSGFWRDANQAIRSAPGDEAIFKAAVDLMLDDQIADDAGHVIGLADAFLALRPDNGMAYHIRSKAKLVQKDYLGSLMDASTALELEPWNLSYSGVRIDLLRKLIDSDEHYGLFQVVIDRMKAELLSPFSSRLQTYLRRHLALAYEARSRYFKRIGDQRSRVDDLTRAVEIAEGQTVYLELRASALIESGKYGEAIADFTRALEIAKTYPTYRRTVEAGIWVGRGDTYVLIGEFDQAIEDYQIALKIEPNASRYKYIESKIMAAKQKRSEIPSRPN